MMMYFVDEERKAAVATTKMHRRKIMFGGCTGTFCERRKW